MTIDIITALDQAFFQAETAKDEQVRKHAIQHFINVAGMLEEQLKTGGIVAIKCDFPPEDLVQAAQRQGSKQAAGDTTPANISAMANGLHDGMGGHADACAELMQRTGKEIKELQWRLEVTANTANRYAKVGVRVMNQRDELLDVLSKVQAFFVTGEQPKGFTVQQLVDCVIENYRRELIVPKQTGISTLATVRHMLEWHPKPLPAETEANLPQNPQPWYKRSVTSTPAPDVINMADPRNWQKGDVIVRGFRRFPYFVPGEECTVTYSDEKSITIVGRSGVEVVYSHGIGEPAANFFTWLRHGDAPTTQA